MTDGICGPTTNKFIRFFQQDAKRRGANCAQDGRVDPVVSGGSISAGSHNQAISPSNRRRNSAIAPCNAKTLRRRRPRRQRRQ
jgi:hypothetical protein